MLLGVVGLGLIGGSLAKAYKESGHSVYACDLDRSIEDMAILQGVCDGHLDSETAGLCDLILIAIYPDETVKWLRDNACFIRKDAIVMDCCGVKRSVCSPCFEIAEEYGFTFVGGHPMAGTQYSGFKYSRPNMFKGAPMVIVPPRFDDMEFLENIKQLLIPAQFGKITVATAEDHDRMIAFTSQLAHVVSNAYIKSRTADEHRGFSAGSYKDLTRVAYLNEDMWTELFLDNRDNLINELNMLIDNLNEYLQAMKENDATRLKEALHEGKVRKQEVDR